MEVKRGWEGDYCLVQLGVSAGIWGVGARSCVQCSRVHVDPLCMGRGKVREWVVVFLARKLCSR